MSPTQGCRVRLVTRHGTLVGYCDVAVQTSKDLPLLPEVITLKGGDGRTFVVIRVGDKSEMPTYREQTFDWADNFQLPVKP